jgi:hypothetical protein
MGPSTSNLLDHKYCCTCASYKPQRSVHAGFCGKKKILKMQDEVCTTWKQMTEPMTIPYNLN